MATTAGDRPDAADGSAGEAGDPMLTVFRLAFFLAVGHLAALAVRPAPTLGELVVLEAVVVLVLVGNELRETRSLVRSASLGVAAVAVVGGLLITLWQGVVLWQATLLFAVVIAVGSYALYRYHLLALGRVEGADEH